MGESLSLFRSSFNKSLRIESRPERLTGEPGAVLLREIMERTRIIRGNPHACILRRVASPMFELNGHMV